MKVKNLNISRSVKVSIDLPEVDACYCGPVKGGRLYIVVFPS